MIPSHAALPVDQLVVSPPVVVPVLTNAQIDAALRQGARDAEACRKGLALLGGPLPAGYFR